MSTQVSAPKAREYETIYILKQDVTRESQERIAGRINELMGREKGRLTLIENWGRRQLAYPVAKKRRGVYVYLKYLGGGALVNELERNLRMLDDVVKFQTVQLRTDVELEGVEVNADDVKFEAVEPPQPGEDDGERLERILGFEEAPERPRSEESQGDEDEFGADANDESGGEDQ
jgi:small subunit ribosomal protein S6